MNSTWYGLSQTKVVLIPEQDIKLCATCSCNRSKVINEHDEATRICSVIFQMGSHLRACFLSLSQRKLRLCSTNHRSGYWTEVTCPVTGWAQPELTPSKRQKTGLEICKLSFWCWDRNIPGELEQSHGCWCPGSLHHQDINSHDINYVG